MARSILGFILSALRWVHWLIQYAVVYPLAMMAMLVVLVFWKGPYTPGQTLVKTVESVQREGYVIQDCTRPASRGELNGDAVKPQLHPVLQEDCTTVSTDAAGYAAHIDRSYTKNILSLWLLMALVFVGGAVVFDRTPASRTNVMWGGNVRGVLLPGSRPGEGAMSPLMDGYQKRGETIIVYDPSAKFSVDDENENKEK